MTHFHRRVLACCLLAVLSQFHVSIAQAREALSPGQTFDFISLDDCDYSEEDGRVIVVAAGNCIEPRRLEALAVLPITAINLDATAYAIAYHTFSVTSAGAETVLNTTVSGNVNWDGVLFGAGLLDAGADVEVVASLYDESARTITGSRQILAEDQNSIGIKGIDVGGSPVRGSREFSFTGTVVRGHNYSVRIELYCNARSGFVGLDIGCVFTPGFIGLGPRDRFVEWRDLSITIEGDIFERIDQLEEKIDVLSEQTEALDEKLMEVIRLLNTAPGQRSSDYEACNGKKCDFPK